VRGRLQKQGDNAFPQEVSMKAIVLAAASALAVAPVVTNAALAAQPAHAGSWSFADYTADPTSLAADDAFHVATGTTITSYCHGSRVPSVPQDVNAHALKVTGASTLKLHLAATGAWGVDVSSRRGASVAGFVTRTAADATRFTVRLHPGAYVVRACNLGGAPTARVDYSLTR